MANVSRVMANVSRVISTHVKVPAVSLKQGRSASGEARSTMTSQELYLTSVRNGKDLIHHQPRSARLKATARSSTVFCRLTHTSTSIPGFEGAIHSLGDFTYNQYREQYAYSSEAAQGHRDSMQPAAVVYPDPKDPDADVLRAIKYASENGLAMAVRTGGHQYSGASSTSGKNIQLDLSEAYKEFEWDKESGLLTAGVSYRLIDFNAKLGKLGLFIPHGQCMNVHLGGHAQTGGYGQLGRSFGLMGDYVEKIRLITADGKVRLISRHTTDAAEADLFYGVLGGSPGNYGVLTHLVMKPLHDKDHPNARGLKLFAPFLPSGESVAHNGVLARLLKVMAEMAADEDFPADFDFCVSVVSDLADMGLRFGLDHDAVDDLLDQAFHMEPREVLPAKTCLGGIILYVQWANLGGKDQVYDPAFFNKIKAALGDSLRFAEVDDDKPTPMSQLTKAWIYQSKREYDTPFIKRTYATTSTTLDAQGWPDFTAERIAEIENDLKNGCRLSVQIQHFGGKHSRFRTNDAVEKKTAYSWRDSTVLSTLDCFYNPLDISAVLAGKNPKAIAENWQQDNDSGFNGTQGHFSKEDRRVLWGSYYRKIQEKDMAVAWPYYHESKEKYGRLCAIKKASDPHNVFTPNKFSVQFDAPKTA